MKPDKKQISAALIEHLNREELHTREAAKFLNINPCYISMAKNENSWDAMGKTAWIRLEQWFYTRENIKDFKIPEGEEIFVVKKKTEPEKYTNIKERRGKLKIEPKVLPEKEPEEHSPEQLVAETKKQSPGKIVRLVINKAEIEDLQKQLNVLQEFIKNQEKVTKELRQLSQDISISQFILLEENFKPLLTRVEDIERSLKPTGITKLPEYDQKPHIVIFQRNIYQK